MSTGLHAPAPDSDPHGPARTASKLALLSSLYFSQGLPYGFFVQALPVLMRQQGRSLEEVGLASLLMLPWGLKIFVAPFIDRRSGSRLGARRGWIVPLQWLTVLSVIGLAFAGGQTVPLAVMAGAVVLTAALAATQDVATDGLAVTLLSDRERGLGNGVQVAAYRIGMVVGGGALLVVFDAMGWFSTFGAMAAALLLATVPILFFDEPVVRRPAAPARSAASALSLLRTFFQRPGMPRWLVLLMLFKIGDAVGSPMVKPLLVDVKMTLAQIGFISGTLGSGVALLGALAGGWMAGRVGRVAALLWGGLLHAALMGGYALAADAGHTLLSVMLVLEHFTGSVATVALFTVMMDASDERTGATDYTVQASAVVWATALGSALSGFGASALGYGPFFVVAAAVCAVGTVLLVADVRRGRIPGRRIEPA